MPQTAAAEAILWLGSYPKTGSTWVREILTNILSGDKRNTAIPSFQKAWPEDLPTHSLWDRQLAVVKTHLYPGHGRMEQVPLPTAGAVVIRRHPLDILLSALNYARVKDKRSIFLNDTPKEVEQIIMDGEFLHYIEEFRDNDGFPWFSGPSGELSLYLDRWRSALQGQPLHEMVYEDLFANPHQEIQSLLKFLAIEANDADIEKIHATSDKRTSQNGEFFWKRRAYNFQALLPEEMIAAFHERCQKQLIGMKYPTCPDSSSAQ